MASRIKADRRTRQQNSRRRSHASFRILKRQDSVVWGLGFNPTPKGPLPTHVNAMLHTVMHASNAWVSQQLAEQLRFTRDKSPSNGSPHESDTIASRPDRIISQGYNNCFPVFVVEDKDRFCVGTVIRVWIEQPV